MLSSFNFYLNSLGENQQTIANIYGHGHFTQNYLSMFDREKYAMIYTQGDDLILELRPISAKSINSPKVYTLNDRIREKNWIVANVFF